MKIPIFITGNENKAKYLSNHLGIDLPYQKLDLKEIQSLEIEEVVIEKANEACKILQKPVLVQDVSLEFSYLGKLPSHLFVFSLILLNFQKC